MAVMSYNIDIACKGKPDDMREMWLALSRPAGDGAEFAFQKLAAYTDKSLDSFVSAGAVDINASINSARGKSKVNPEIFYPVLAKAFPCLKFFIVHYASGGNSASCVGFEAKGGRMRVSGRWEYENTAACETRRAWMSALQGHWLLQEEFDNAAPAGEAAAIGEAGSAAESGPPPEVDTGARKETSAEALERVVADGDSLESVKKQTPKICLAAVDNKGGALRFVKKQSLKICRAAVKQDGLALEFVREKTRELCRAAVKQNYLAYRYVRETSPAIYRQFMAGFQEALAQNTAT
jgi:hypothetical protein